MIIVRVDESMHTKHLFQHPPQTEFFPQNDWPLTKGILAVLGQRQWRLKKCFLLEKEEAIDLPADSICSELHRCTNCWKR